MLHLFAEIGLLVDQTYQSVLDLQIDICAVLDLFGEIAFGFDGECLAAT